ncbi:ribonuclease HII [Oceanospirillum sp.]|uniref:ribonuclease HII n=1 Tax=Oceanospirillum sp. TaxID=2021254 RepID=UPI003A8E340D
MAHDWPELDIPYQGKLLAGVDEVGRGPLVGSVVTAAVILDPDRPISGLTDSKKLSEKKREAFFDEIKEKALAWHIAECSVAEIDRLNILHATMLAMQRAVAGLKPAAEFVLIDGNRCPDMPCPAMAVVKGDLRHAAISAASILAKVYRDQQMVELEARYPGYGFAQHKGYPTKQHFAALEKLGPIPEHRRSFKPVQQRLDL